MSSNPVSSVVVFDPAPSPLGQEMLVECENEAGNAELWLYRERTIAMLRRYLRFALEVGRLPSILGRECFRSKVTSYRMVSFEDAVIFVHDVERALERLALFHQQVIATVIFQEYTQEEAAEVLCSGRRTLSREFPIAVDCVTEIFLMGGLLNKQPTEPVEKTCQGGEAGSFQLNDCNQSE